MDIDADGDYWALYVDLYNGDDNVKKLTVISKTVLETGREGITVALPEGNYSLVFEAVGKRACVYLDHITVILDMECQSSGRPMFSVLVSFTTSLCYSLETNKYTPNSLK